MTENFVLLVFPEVGWIGVAIAVGGCISELRGVGERVTRQNFVDDAPLGALRIIRIAIFVGCLFLGIGLLLQSRTLFSWSLAIEVLVFLVLIGMIKGYGKPGVGKTTRFLRKD